MISGQIGKFPHSLRVREEFIGYALIEWTEREAFAHLYFEIKCRTFETELIEHYIIIVFPHHRGETACVMKLMMTKYKVSKIQLIHKASAAE